jgi:gamma-glutamyl-gamma-aminobutyrate hydrolase PuuD
MQTETRGKFVLVSTQTPEKAGVLGVRNTVLDCLNRIGLPYMIVHGGMSDALLQHYLKFAAGIIIPGGTDINPELYGQRAHPTTDTPDHQRDYLELYVLLSVALERNIPVLAFCRGMQLLAVADGAALLQHLPDVLSQETHGKVGGVYADLYQPEAFTNDRPVNIPIRSMHHQAVDSATLRDLHVVGTSPSGVVEVLVHPKKKFYLGFQGHLEADIAVTHPSPTFLMAVLEVFRQAVLEE